MKKISIVFILAFCTFVLNLKAQTPIVTYAGNTGKERFNAVVELSDGTVLVAGGADNLDWIPASAPRTQIAATGINNASGTNKIGFLLHLSANLQNVLRVVHFPANAVEEINFIKTTNAPGAPTGQLYISGRTLDLRANGGGYFIARLNNNFVGGAPTATVWAKSIYATGDHQTFQPWDVASDGKVVYATGEPFGANWAAIYRLKADGTDDVVPDWRYHFGTLNTNGATVEGSWTPAASRTDVTVRQSAIVLKIGGRCDLRSWTQADYDAEIADGNGSTKKGKYPLDLFFSSPCNPASPTATSPGYTGYSPGANPTQRVGGIVIDRRNNHLYVGFAIQSRLPDGLPDFEPAVLAMTETGAMKWWSRLYSERNRTTSAPQVSTPDQYVDGLAIDYSKPAATTELTVLARSHGNNTTNLWAGNSISAAQNPLNPGSSFHNGFTGTNGNIHISWIGKLRVDDGTLMYASYNAEYVDGATNYGAPYTEPIHDGWANHNAGWADLNTTRCKTDVEVDLAGRVYLTCVGRRTVTTSNAYQKMLKFGQGSSTWNSYVRVYEPNLKTLAYSSLLVGNWDAATGAGGDNTDVMGIFPTNNGLFAVGYHKLNTTTNTASGNAIPTANTPLWGASAPNGESAILARLPFSTQAANPTEFDFDGDRKADVAVFRPSNGAWYLNQSQNGFSAVAFGIATDKIVPADYDGDGKTDVAVYRDGVWYLLRSQLGFTAVSFGNATDVPQPADFDGDGKAEVAVFRPSTGGWFYLNLANNQFGSTQFGTTNDKPVIGDYDGDGRADFAVFRPSNGVWYLLRSTAGFTALSFGLSTDALVPADYDGDGKTDVAVYRSGSWFMQRSQAGFAGVSFGIASDLPAPADFDGDGRADVAVFRSGSWFILGSTNGFSSVGFGIGSDAPVSNAFVK